MKQICLILITTLFLFGCKKDHNKDIESSTFGTAHNSFANKIVLNEVKVAGDSAKVSWSQLDTSAFVSYTLLRKDYTYLPMVAVKQLSKKDQTTTTDYSLPFSPIIQYQVEGHLASGKTITSNVITCLRPDFTLPTVTSFDVKYNSLDQTLYFTENNGNISVYSLIKKTVIKSINTHAKIGYCDFGTYAGREELYVPTNNGWVYIYDAETLEKIAQINTGLNNFCVVFKNDNLYIISTAGSSDSAFKVYSRQTGNKIFDSGSSELIKFKAVPNSNFDLFGITINSVPVNQSYYRFAANGAFISRSNGNYLGNYPLDAAIFEFFPDGSKYITSSSGAIYNRSMIYETSLPGGKLMFTAFAASQVDNMIYAGTDKYTVEVYSISNYQHVKTIKTSSLPSKIFDLGNQLLCVGWIDGSSSCDNCQLPAFANIVIEKIEK